MSYGDAMSLQKREIDPQLELAVMDVLSRGPLRLDELRVELAADHRIVSDDELQPMRWHPEVFDFADETYGHLPTLAEGVVLAHELSERELELGMLDAGVDLALWSRIADEGFPLAAGGALTVQYAGRGEAMPGDSGNALVGPEGWLDGYAVGDVIALRYVGGRAVLERAVYPEDPDADEAYGEELLALVRVARRVVEAEIEYGDAAYPGADPAEIVMRLRHEHPGAMNRPLPPLGDLFEALGLEIHRGYVGAPGTAWDGEPELLDERQRAAWRAWRTSLELAEAGDIPADSDLTLLAGSLTGILLDYVSLEMDLPEGQRLADAMANAVTGPLSAVPLMLLARAAEARGDGAGWLSFLERAVAADPGHAEALGDLADLRSVSGDAREAKRLYGLAGVDPQTDEVRLLRRYLEPPADGPGRNRPCPCGSGKKYKLCHGRTAVHPLSARASWLFHKVTLFIQRPWQREELIEWGALLAGTDTDDPEAVRRAMGDQTTWEFAVFEGGLLAAFLRVLGPLLPEDERELAAKWSTSRRRLMEVLDVMPMRGVRVRDLLTSEELEIRDRTLTRTIQEMDLLLGVLLDDGDGVLRFQLDPLSIPRLMRSRLLELLRAGASGEEVASFLAPRAPQMQTTTGEELVMCVARYECADPDTIWEALDEQLDRHGDSALALLGADDVILGTVDRDGALLVVRTNAIERLRTLQEIVKAAGSGVRLVDESTRPWESIDPDELGRPTESPELDPADVVQIQRQLEERWLADSIPALGGLTPREAAASEDARAELAALLDDFEWSQRRSPQQIDFDVARLRRELGLEQ